MFLPNQRVQYRDKDRWMDATIIRVFVPFIRKENGGVAYEQGPEPTALIHLDDGTELCIPCSELRLSPPADG